MKRKLCVWASLAASAIATPGFAATLFSDPLTSDAGNFSLESTSDARAISYSASGVTFGGVSGGDGGRNILYTNDTNYNTISYVAYVTADLPSGNNTLYFGMGKGIIGTFGEADLTAGGEPTDQSRSPIVSGTIHLNLNTRTSDPTQFRINGPSPSENAAQNFPSASYGTDRIQMTYDATAMTVVYAINFNYNGTFTPDYTSSPVDLSAADFTTGASIYLESDDGGILRDFSVSAPSPEPASVGFLALGSLGLLARRRRR
ncbi:MAG: hypothetical protein JWP03_403 [Phycisphaerales bacterium]|nr:hypothetical protein [Phycisphaerales bacterium]